MKLSYQGKKELREKIIEQLSVVPEGQRIHIDREILEDLLFEVVTLDKTKKIEVRIPVWSGDFLKKIDLSEIDFTNVSWEIMNMSVSDQLEEVILPELAHDYDIDLDDSYAISLIRKIQKDNDDRFELATVFLVEYDGTNAKIDLSKSFEAIHKKRLSIRHCNFTGLDFSQQDLTAIDSISVFYSSLSGTKLPIGNIPLIAYGSSLNGINLSTKKINGLNYLEGDDGNNFGDCDLTDCGVQITLDFQKFREDIEKSISELYNQCSETYIETVKKQHERALQQAMNKDWVGCYVNGKKVLSLEEKLALAPEKREELKKMKEDILNSVLESIEEQTKHIK